MSRGLVYVCISCSSPSGLPTYDDVMDSEKTVIIRDDAHAEVSRGVSHKMSREMGHSLYSLDVVRLSPAAHPKTEQAGAGSEPHLNRSASTGTMPADAKQKRRRWFKRGKSESIKESTPTVTGVRYFDL
ncbi:uncharacterized protein LOC131927637 [Physella acuta]|uniref:uncharacterized protein LOC131927637 n=1 Tax=Physella acuta TaxID=109671 RepID=UPI0027DE49AC|nr:uncharacterized protein LOC131927637 [Physella acuta]